MNLIQVNPGVLIEREYKSFFKICRRSSVVEQSLRKGKVGGSTPPVGSI